MLSQEVLCHHELSKSRGSGSNPVGRTNTNRVGYDPISRAVAQLTEEETRNPFRPSPKTLEILILFGLVQAPADPVGSENG